MIYVAVARTGKPCFGRIQRKWSYLKRYIYIYTYSVWDIYQEDMEEYLEQKSEIRQRFIEANQPVPPSLSSSNKSAAEQVQEEMDPTIRAFVEMERKLGNRN